MEDFIFWMKRYDSYLVFTFVLLISAATVVHVLLNKRDPRAAFNWILISMLLPGVGPICYWIGGINRIRTRATTWAEKGRWGDEKTFSGRHLESLELSNPLPIEWSIYAPLVKVGSRMTRRPLLGDNKIKSHYNGEQAYPAMLQAISQAKKFVYLSTFIFDNDKIGMEFVKACADARARGVDVRVIIDGVGCLYSFPTILQAFRREGIRVASFLNPFSVNGLRFNLRNHRKILVVDGYWGFTGGMNISQRHIVERKNKVGRSPVKDIHFEFIGPVVTHLEETFLTDWYFVTEELTPVRGDAWNQDDSRGSWCRGISAGPNNEMERLYWVVLGALSVARKKIRIMTPYFVPDRALLSAICAAALRGVEVILILPAKNNIPLIHWAARAYLYEIIQAGVHVYYQPAPFVHTKLLLIDDVYTLVGSINIDARSLRLNFEFCVETYDNQFSSDLCRHFDEAKLVSEKVTEIWLNKQPTTQKLIDGVAKLFSPYL